MITLTPVDSSNVSGVGHDGTNLLIRFKSGQVYAYPGQPRSHYDAIIAADSKGKFVNAWLKANKPAFTKLEA